MLMTFVRSLWNDMLRPANGNGHWRNPSMKTRTSAKHAWARAVVAAATVAGALIAAGPAPAIVTLRIATTDGTPGGQVTLTMSITGIDDPSTISSAQTDVIFDTSQLRLMGACSAGGASCEKPDDCVPTDTNFCELPCQPASRLTEQSFVASLPPFQNLPPEQERLRLYTGATTFPPPTFGDGLLSTCVFDVPTDATAGVISLVPNRVNVGDNLGQVVPSDVVVEPGSIVIPEPTPTGTLPTPTVTGTPPTPTETGTPATPTPTVTGTPPTPTETGTPATPTPTVTGTPPTPTETGTPATATPTGTPPTETPTLTPTEIPCVGDCGNDGKVTQADLVIGTGIDLETTPYEECPQFDRDHNNAVTVDEIVQGINNFALPVCPAPPST
jgi:hypothetical protein